MTVESLIDGIVVREGGYVDHPSDRGGPTKFGITMDTLADWRHPKPVGAVDVQGLTVAEAKQIYRRRYIEAPGFDKIADPRLQALVVDYAVHSGPGRAVKALQRAIGVTDDGILGPSTLHFLGLSEASDVFKRLLAARIASLVRQVLDDPSQRVFLDGWLNRVVSFL